MIANPKNTAKMVQIMRRLIVSRKNTQLNKAENTGIVANMKTTFATLVLLTARTKVAVVDPINTT